MLVNEINRIKLLSERIYQHQACLDEMKEFNQLLEQYQDCSAKDWIKDFTTGPFSNK